MNKLSIKNIVEFRRKSDKAKKNFVTALKIDKPKKEIEGGGGDYWISCVSAISKSHRLNDLQSIIDKRDELEGKYEETKYKITKTMYKRNIDILYNYESFDLKKWRPSKIKFLKKHKEDSILTIKGLQVQANPHRVFTFQKNEANEVGSIWFIAKLGGYTKEELGMFTDILYRYLNTHFSKDYAVNTKYCIAVDLFNGFEINYSQLEKEEIPRILSKTLDEINRLM